MIWLKKEVCLETNPSFAYIRYKQGCGSSPSVEEEARKFYRFHMLFDLKTNLAKKFCPFPNVD